MKRSFADDALEWESGRMSLDELSGRHPGTDVVGLTAMFDRLQNVSDVHSDPEAGWAVLRERLPERLEDWNSISTPRLGSLRGRLRRTLVSVAAATVALVGGTSIAYAAGVQPVRNEVHRIATTISHLFTGHDGDGQRLRSDASNGEGRGGVEPPVPGSTRQDQAEPAHSRKGGRGYGASKKASHASHPGNEGHQGGKGDSPNGKGGPAHESGNAKDASHGGDHGGGSSGPGADETQPQAKSQNGSSTGHGSQNGASDDGR